MSYSFLKKIYNIFHLGYKASNVSKKYSEEDIGREIAQCELFMEQGVFSNILTKEDIDKGRAKLHAHFSSRKPLVSLNPNLLLENRTS